MGYAMAGYAMLAAILGSGASSNWWGMGGDEEAESQQEMWDKEQQLREQPAQFREAPRFPETDEARGMWGGKLKAWGEDPNYGGIPLNWDEIWKKAKTRLDQTFYGGATGPGIADKMKASAARRGVSESPAMGTLLSRVGAEHGLQTKELATDIATKEAEFGESGRRTWLQSLTQMANLQTPGAWDKYGGMSVVQPTPMGWGDIAGGVTDIAGNYMQSQWLDKQKKEERNWWSGLIGSQSGGTTQGSITAGGGGGYSGDKYGWGDTYRQGCTDYSNIGKLGRVRQCQMTESKCLRA